VDTLAAGHYQSNILDAKQSIIQTITKYEGSLFKPELVKLFLQLSNNDAFGLSQEQNHVSEFIAIRSKSATSVFLDVDTLKELASIFAEIVDCKSRFTHQHSLGWLGLADTWQHFLVWKMRSEIRLKLLVFCTTWESSKYPMRFSINLAR